MQNFNNQLSVMRKHMLHPAALFWSWLSLLVALQFWIDTRLAAISGLFLFAALIFCRQRFVLLMRRSRWILVTVVFIYAYSGNGELLWPVLGSFSPLEDGVVSGFRQLLRLLLILSSLSLLLEYSGRDGLLQALHTFLSPLASAGIDIQRVMVRLALTMEFMEKRSRKDKTSWASVIEEALPDRDNSTRLISFSAQNVSVGDWLLALLITALLVWLAL